MNKIQIIYSAATDGSGFHKYFADEAAAMKRRGFIVGTTPHDEADTLIYRGFTISTPDKYPTDKRFVQGWYANRKTLLMSEYIDEIRQWTFGSFTLPELSDDILRLELAKRGWQRAFIKAAHTSLFAFGDDASVWPDTSAARMMELYGQLKASGPFIVREYIDNQEIFYNEQRYWVLNGKVNHPSGIVPDFVAQAAKRIWDLSGSLYFTIDVAGEYIVEVNPGESSDRGCDNPVEYLSEIFAEAFLKNLL